MPLRRMPNGEYVDVPANISPEALAKIEAQYKAAPKAQAPQRSSNENAGVATPTRTPSKVPEKKANETTDEETIRKVAEFRKRQAERPWYMKPFFGAFDGGAEDAQRMAASGFLANFDDELAGVAGGSARAIKGVFTGDENDTFSRGYDVARGIERAEKSRIRQDRPITGTVGEIGGAILNPLGAGSRVLGGAGKVAERLGMGRVAQALGTGSAKIANAGPVATGVLAGANQGALNAAGASEDLSSMPSDMLTGAAGGAAFGGLLGGAGYGAGRVMQTLRDRKPENAGRVALNEVSEALGKAGISPARAESTLARANATGNDMAVMDLAPSLGARAGKLSRNTDLPASNELAEFAGSRVASRGERIAGKIDDTAGLPQGRDALDFDDYLQAQRKGIGSALYANGGALDQPINNSAALEKFLIESPDVSKLLDDAYTMAMRMGDDLQTMQRASQGGVTMVPTMRVFDRLKREFDTKIGIALRNGEKTLAEGLSKQLKELKRIVGKDNPEWEPVLATMRDQFQKEEALRKGAEVWSKVRKQPRVAMREVRGYKGEQKDNARLGIIDKFIEDVVGSGNPSEVLAAVTRNKHQRELMEWAFGSTAKFNQFRRWANREFKSVSSDDNLRRLGTASSQGGDNIGDAALLAREGVAGGAFGGMAGIAANVSRRLASMKPSGTIDAQEEIARILMSDGKGMADEMKAVAKYMADRAKRAKSRSRWLGKAGQQPFSTEIGGE